MCIVKHLRFLIEIVAIVQVFFLTKVNVLIDIIYELFHFDFALSTLFLMMVMMVSVLSMT
jgi:hypothetical protein